jgi:putative DNA primase/helicase
MQWLDEIKAGHMAGDDLIQRALSDIEGPEIVEDMILAIISDDLNAQRIRRALLESGAKATDVSSLLAHARKEARERQRQMRQAPPARISRIEIPGHVPGGYIVDDDGIWRQKQERMDRASYQPVWVSRRLVDTDTRLESWELSWQASRGVRSLQCPRTVAQGARLITALADQGFPVSSDTAGDMVAYLEAYAAANPGIPISFVSRRCGWSRGGSFVWGGEAIGGSVEVECVDPGMARIVRGCHAHEDADASYKLHELMMRYPALLVAYAAALTSPVLHPLQAPGFVVSFDGRTSAGKTTAIRVAASVWGRPSDLDGLVYTWDTTAYFLQRQAAQMGHLPLCLDDTRRWKGKAEALADTVYDLTQGQERGRMVSGHKAQEQRYWRLVTISTGEDPLGAVSGAGGLRGRVLPLWGSPFGGSAAADVRACNEATALHYGTAGPDWVRELMARGVETLRERQAEWLRRHPIEGDVAGRLASHAALVAVVAWTAAEWLRWPMEDPREAAQSVWGALIPGIVAGDADADPAERAWAELEAWLVSLGEGMAYRGAAVGRIHSGEWQLVPSVLRDWMEAAGYRYPAILAAWAQTGRISRRDVPHMTTKVQWGDSRPRLVCLRQGEAR